MTGTWKNGRIVLDGPTNWPDGCRLRVEPAAQEETLGMREADWPADPEGIAGLLAKMDAIEPLEITPEEEAEFWAYRQKVKEYCIAKMQEDLEGSCE